MAAPSFSGALPGEGKEEGGGSDVRRRVGKMAAEAEGAAMEAPLEAELEAELDLEGAELEEVDVHIQENLEDALVQEALQTGVDLRQYSRQVELELQEVERASIQDYIRESENIAELHNQISACRRHPRAHGGDAGLVPELAELAQLGDPRAAGPGRRHEPAAAEPAPGPGPAGRAPGRARGAPGHDQRDPGGAGDVPRSSWLSCGRSAGRSRR
ncbi:vacuolar protein sorting-associated protein 52 homolog isoform X2 [Chamaea fasciata]|uniref:vacuolar protein sorting-associated protein 52 homolog isoform X2 n=1 Tax=Chamaea fasciata TaxID=190680 RepID=UPI00336A4B30